MTAARSLGEYPVHLGLGARAIAQPAFSGMEWYSGYAERVAADGAEGRLVSLYEFTADWESWEVHPAGDEVVVCLTGEIVLWQQGTDGGAARVALGAGDYAINPAGVWHTADIAAAATCLFITAGLDTNHRPR